VFGLAGPITDWSLRPAFWMGRVLSC